THRSSSVAPRQEHQNLRVNRGAMLDSNRGLENQRLTGPATVSSDQFLLKHMVGMNGYTNIEQLFLARSGKEILCREHALNLDRKSTRLNSSHTVISYA